MNLEPNYIIKTKNKPVAVVIDYEAYTKMIDIIEDKLDLELLIKAEKQASGFTSLEDFKKEIEKKNE